MVRKIPKEFKKGRGHPPIPIDWEKVDSLLVAGCKGTEIAGYFGIHEDTLYSRCVQEKSMVFSAYARIKYAKGDGIIRAVQYEVAVKKKDRSMLQFLGKTRLKQGDLDSEKIDAKLDDLKNAITELGGETPGTEKPGEQRMENEPSLQDQRPLRKLHNNEAELGADRADE